MTTQRPGAASTDLATLVLTTAGELAVRTAWENYGDQITPALRSVADDVRVAGGDAVRRFGEDMRAHGADLLQDLAAQARTRVGELGRDVTVAVWDAFGRALVGGQQGARG